MVADKDLGPSSHSSGTHTSKSCSKASDATSPPTKLVADKELGPSSHSSGTHSSKSGRANDIKSPPSTKSKTTSSSKHASSKTRPPTSGSTSIKSPKPHGTKPRPSSSMQKARRGSTAKKSITFKKTVAVLTIPNLDTYTIQEKEQSWFAADDYGQMEDECDMTAELLDRRKPLWPGQCPRGLEAWTTEGEQRKEGHVQLALDIVWQAQLEQWKASSDIHECWEFIRSRYLAVTVPCQTLANKRASVDEQEVQGYLAGVRSVEKNRLRLLGIRHRDVRTRRHSHSESDDHVAPTSVSKKISRSFSGISDSSTSSSKSPPNRHHSSDNIRGSQKGLLKSPPGEDTLSALPSGRMIRHQPSSSQDKPASGEDGASVASSVPSRKITYHAKSKSKIPTSPVQSLCSMHESDDDSLSRRMRSHMSVASEDSTRRRMLRTNGMKPPLG